MKSSHLIKALGALVALVTVVTLAGSSVYGEAPALQIPVIKGTITNVDFENNCLLIQGSDILGSKPLYLSSKTGVFKGYKGINFDELNRNAGTISALDRVELSNLNIDDEICCTYSYSKDGKLIADSIVIEIPSKLVPGM